MDNKKYIETCFTTLYRLIKNDPEKIDENIIDIFTKFIPYDPCKSFILLSNYYNMYIEDIHESIEQPYEMILLLINYFNYFIVSDISESFIKLLIYIALKDEIVGPYFIDNGFLDDTVNCLLLENIKDDTLSLVYQLLFILSSQTSQEIEIDDKIIKSHLKKGKVMKDVLSFLLISKIKIGPKTVRALSNIGLHRSLFVLFQFALSKKYDHSCLVESPDWLGNTIFKSNSILQMRIFLALLADKKCQKRLACIPQTVEYLLNLISLKTADLLKLVSTCARRLIFPESLENFQKKHFFKKFWDEIKSTEQSTRDPCIMAIDMLVDTKYIDDLNDILNDMADVINFGDSSSSQAIKIIAKASTYPQCKNVLKKYKKYFVKLSSTGEFQDECQMFQNNIK